MYASMKSNVTFHGCHFLKNVGSFQGGVLNVWQSSAHVYNCTFNDNHVDQCCGGVMVVHGSNSNLTVDNCQFLYNMANTSGGVLKLATANVRLYRSKFVGNSAITDGGVVWSLQCAMTMINVNFANNKASNGGAIYSYDSKLQLYGHTNFSNNTANDSGGGMYLDRSDMVCRHYSKVVLSNNKAGNKGGGIYATITFITVMSNRSSSQETVLGLDSNMAESGGGVYLETASVLEVQKSGTYNDYKIVTKHTNMYFISNSADYGGAVYIDDSANFETCKSLNTQSSNNCFLQVVRYLHLYFLIIQLCYNVDTPYHCGQDTSHHRRH